MYMYMSLNPISSQSLTVLLIYLFYLRWVKRKTGPRNNETHGEISNYHIQNLRALLKGESKSRPRFTLTSRDATDVS